VTARLVENLRRLNNQEMQLLNEQLKALRQTTNASTPAMMASPMADSSGAMASMGPASAAGPGLEALSTSLVQRLESRTRDFVQTPACNAIASLALIEVTLAPEADPGDREIRLITAKGISNPMIFQVGILPEHVRKPMPTTSRQILGKEVQALRKRPDRDVEVRVSLPCTVNGQIGSGEANRYRFSARKGQHLILATQARRLIPFIADAVPGWVQPVLTLLDADGREVAYQDDFRFQPDPTLHVQVPRDGEYVAEIRDGIYRGREDFVYRMSLGEVPLVTAVFPAGGRVGEHPALKLLGWNLEQVAIEPPGLENGPGIRSLLTPSNHPIVHAIPFDIDTLPEIFDKEPNEGGRPQKVRLPLVVNGRIDRPGDVDVFAFEGRSGDSIVVEVRARRLHSPLDSMVRLTDATGKMVALNDDHEDLASGPNTHQADSYLMARLPSDGSYRVWLSDTSGQGGSDWTYRLRMSAPRPDFELRVVPSSLGVKTKSTGALTVYAMRRDGFAGPIQLGLENLPPGLTCAPVTMGSTQAVARLTLKADANPSRAPVDLHVVGKATLAGKTEVRGAVPAEDRMQAFLWRQLVPATDLPVLVYDAGALPPMKRPPPELPKVARVEGGTSPGDSVPPPSGGAASTPGKPKFTQQQITARLRQLKLLYEEGFLTDGFYLEKLAECETAP
jgi:hypothetical protein